MGNVFSSQKYMILECETREKNEIITRFRWEYFFFLLFMQLKRGENAKISISDSAISVTFFIDIKSHSLKAQMNTFCAEKKKLFRREAKINQEKNGQIQKLFLLFWFNGRRFFCFSRLLTSILWLIIDFHQMGFRDFFCV